MASDMLELLLRLALAASVAIVAALLLRRPLRRFAGADAAYLCWLMVPLALLAAALPSLRVAPALVLVMAPALAPANLVAQVAAPSATSPIELALLAWALGAMAACAILLAGQRRFVRRLGRLARHDGLFVAAHSLYGPALLGLWHPIVVVPADFTVRYTPAEQVLIVAHERLHAERCDPLANAALALLQCALWFNPLVHIAAARFRFDQELACDAGVLARAGGQRQAYAAAMLKTQSAGAPALATCHWQSSHPLKERIMHLKQTTSNVRRRAGLGIVALLACTSVMATIVARAETVKRNTYMMAFKFAAAGVNSAPSVMAAAGEPFAVSSANEGTVWKGDFLITEDKEGMVWLKTQFTINGKLGGTHNGSMASGQPRKVTITAQDGRDLIAMQATVSPVKKADGT